MSADTSMSYCLSLSISLGQDELRCKLCLWCSLGREGHSLRALPALDAFVIQAKLDSNHGFGADAIKCFIAASLELVELVWHYAVLERVSEVGRVLGIAARQFNYDALIVYDGPVSSLHNVLRLGSIEHIDGIVRI